MRCTIRGVSLLAAILVAGCLAAGCGGTVQSAIGSVTSSRTAASPATLPATTAQPATTAPPATTAAPTATTAPSTPSVAPSTAVTTVTTTATPTVGATTPAAASPTASASGGSSGTNLIWLWVLLGVLVLAGLITWIARSGRRRSAAAAGWRSKLIDAYAKGSALHDAMSVAEMQGDLAAGDARTRWYDIQRRADDLAQTLYTLREAAPDPGDQARIADVLASLQAARSAMDAERAPGGAGPLQADVVRSRLSAFESSLRALRAGDQEFS
jgi:hypothetical protein